MLANAIELHLGRQIDFSKEILLRNDSDGKDSYIYQWNVTEPKPKEADVLKTYNASTWESTLKIKTIKERLKALEEK